jgi:hypothetical protein
MKPKKKKDWLRLVLERLTRSLGKLSRKENQDRPSDNGSRRRRSPTNKLLEGRGLVIYVRD